MANSRIKDISITATSTADDDYLVIDGETNGTRKISASGVGGNKVYDFVSSLTPSIDSRGVTSTGFNVVPTDSSVMSVGDTYAFAFKAFLESGSMFYMLDIISVSVSSTYFFVQVKSHGGNPQNTSSTTVSGTLHIVAPFEIRTVTQGM